MYGCSDYVERADDDQSCVKRGEIMKNISSKIRKLIKALEMRGEIYLYTKEQIYSL